MTVPEPEAYPGDFHGVPELTYVPVADAAADPGEIVWSWVPFEEDYSRGKDRPVLVIGHDDPWLLGLPLTSHDHDIDAAQEAHEGRLWIDIGVWADHGRPSEARVNRIVRLDPARIRRIAARLDRAVYDAVAAAVRAHADRQPRGRRSR